MGKDHRNNLFGTIFNPQRMKSSYPYREASLQIYLDEIRTYPLISPEEERRLLHLVVEKRDQEAALRLFHANLRLVVSIATYFQGRGPALMDLIQEGNLGLQESIQKFDFAKGQRLNTYAKFYILRRIDRALTESGAIRIPYHTAKKKRRIQEAVNQFLEGGTEPTVQQIAQIARIPEAQVRELLLVMQEPVSLDWQRDPEQQALVEDLAAPVGQSDEALLLEAREAIQTLPDPYKSILNYRSGFYDGRAYTQPEIGSILGYTKARIGQLERQALAMLRKKLAESDTDWR
jgi:RNA polymerase primary sigma factor